VIKVSGSVCDGALGTCGAKENIPPAAGRQRAGRLAHTFRRAVSETLPCKRHFRSQQRRSMRFELFLPSNHLTRAGKKGTLWMSESKGSLVFCRERGNIQSKQDDWQLFGVCEMLQKKKYWKERLAYAWEILMPLFSLIFKYCSQRFIQPPNSSGT